MTLRVVEIRYDENGKSFLAFQGQTNEEAHEMNCRYREERDRAAARMLNEKFGRKNDETEKSN